MHDLPVAYEKIRAAFNILSMHQFMNLLFLNAAPPLPASAPSYSTPSTNSQWKHSAKILIDLYKGYLKKTTYLVCLPFLSGWTKIYLGSQMDYTKDAFDTLKIR